MNRLRLLALALLLACSGKVQGAPEPPPPPPDAPVLQDLPLTALDGAPLPPDALAGKAVLFVNVASQCGFTNQYEGLEALYRARKDDGLVVVGVPCNQFGAQEPGSAEEIATFCQRNFGVSFPLLEKQDVNGGDRSPLYARLVGSAVGGGRDIRWNFEKFVVGRDGRVVARFPSDTRPDDPALAAALAQALAAR